jgi:hypothetical protein
MDLLYTPHQRAGEVIDIGRWEKEGRVLPSQLDTGWDHDFCGSRCYLLAHRLTPDDCEYQKCFMSGNDGDSHVICLTSSFLVTVSAKSGRQMTS